MQRNFWRPILIAVLVVMLATPGRAETITAARDQLFVGIIVAGALVATLIVVVVHHKHKTKSITGCISPGVTGMNVTDEKNKQTYSLDGGPTGLKAGERMTLTGRVNGSAFVTERVAKDLGACTP